MLPPPPSLRMNLYFQHWDKNGYFCQVSEKLDYTHRNREFDEEQQKRHFESWETFWGRPGYGAPRGVVQKGNLMKMLHYPEKVTSIINISYFVSKNYFRRQEVLNWSPWNASLLNNLKRVVLIRLVDEFQNLFKYSNILIKFTTFMKTSPLLHQKNDIFKVWAEYSHFSSASKLSSAVTSCIV